MDYSNFGNAPTEQGGNGGEVIPEGTLAWAILTVRPHNLDHGMVLKPSKSTDGNAYLDAELTILDGPFARRKLWDMVMLQSTGEKAEKTMGMAMAKVRHILEVGREIQGFSPNDAKYHLGKPGDQGDIVLMELDGLRCAIKIGVEAGQKDAQGNKLYLDKNRVRQYLSPNPASDTFNTFMRLVNGDTAPAAAASPSAAKPAAENKPAWAANKPAAVAPAAQNRPAWAGSGPAAQRDRGDVPF